jgi:hypothetical protein
VRRQPRSSSSDPRVGAFDACIDVLQGVAAIEHGNENPLARGLLSVLGDDLKRHDMEAFAPDFSSFWLGSESRDSAAANTGAPDDEALSQSLKEALDALAERVNAARSVV